jgi:hypothetical protein
MNLFKINIQNSHLIKTIKLLKYVIGEVLFVVIGILLAVQIRNWYEIKKNRIDEQVLYHTLIASLESDLHDVNKKVYNINKSIKAQEVFIINSFDAVKSNYGTDQLEDLLTRVSKTSVSFFPNDGMYYKISNNNQINLIQSENLQIKIVELYEQYYKRYKDIDANLEQMAVFSLFTNYYSKIQEHYIVNNKRYNIDYQLLEKNYELLQIECSKIHTLTIVAESSMIECEKEIEELLFFLRKELKRNES